MGKTNRETKVFKEDEETRSTSDISIATDRCKHVFTQDFSVATVLVVAYLIETIVQVRVTSAKVVVNYHYVCKWVKETKKMSHVSNDANAR